MSLATARQYDGFDKKAEAESIPEAPGFNPSFIDPFDVRLFQGTAHMGRELCAIATRVIHEKLKNGQSANNATLPSGEINDLMGARFMGAVRLPREPYDPDYHLKKDQRGPVKGIKGVSLAFGYWNEIGGALSVPPLPPSRGSSSPFTPSSGMGGGRSYSRGARGGAASAPPTIRILGRDKEGKRIESDEAKFASKPVPERRGVDYTSCDGVSDATAPVAERRGVEYTSLRDAPGGEVKATQTTEPTRSSTTTSSATSSAASSVATVTPVGKPRYGWNKSTMIKYGVLTGLELANQALMLKGWKLLNKTDDRNAGEGRAPREFKLVLTSLVTPSAPVAPYSARSATPGSTVRHVWPIPAVETNQYRSQSSRGDVPTGSIVRHVWPAPAVSSTAVETNLYRPESRRADDRCEFDSSAFERLSIRPDGDAHRDYESREPAQQAAYQPQSLVYGMTGSGQYL